MLTGSLVHLPARAYSLVKVLTVALYARLRSCCRYLP